MTEKQRQEAKQFVEQWKVAGPLLEKIRHEELRNFSHEQNAERIDRLLAEGLVWQKVQRDRPQTGLIEMYQVLTKAKH